MGCFFSPLVDVFFVGRFFLFLFSGVGLFIVVSVWMAYSSTLISATHPASISGFIRVLWELLLALAYFRHKGPRLFVSSERHINPVWKCNPCTHDGPAGAESPTLASEELRSHQMSHLVLLYSIDIHVVSNLSLIICPMWDEMTYTFANLSHSTI